MPERFQSAWISGPRSGYPTDPKHGRYDQSTTPKSEHGPDPIEAHLSRASSSPGGPPSGIPVSTPPQRPSWEAGFGSSESPFGSLRPWVLLAWARVREPQGAHGQVQRRLLASEN